MTDLPSTEHAQRGAPSRPEQGVWLDQPVRAWVEDPRVRDAFRALFAFDLHGCTLSWPRAARTFAGATGLRAGDVYVEVVRSPANTVEQVGLSLPADSAARLIDALLGGRPASSIASACGQPSDAECGVLAYAAARLLASRQDSAFAPWLLRDVRPSAPSIDFTSGSIAWPLALHGALGSFEATLWLSQAMVAPQPRQHTLALTLPERVERETLAQLSVGDVWLSEDSPLTLTSEGLTGPVQLSVAGCDTSLHGRLARGKVRVALAEPARPTPPPTERVELVIATCSASLLELAELASGASIAVDASGREPAVIRHGGSVIATGELVSFRGALGIRIVSC